MLDTSSGWSGTKIVTAWSGSLDISCADDSHTWSIQVLKSTSDLFSIVTGENSVYTCYDRDILSGEKRVRALSYPLLKEEES